jgi:hypothetical protein
MYTAPCVPGLPSHFDTHFVFDPVAFGQGFS